MTVGRFAFRRLTREDFGVLGSWLAAPHVREWWNHDPSPEAIEEDFGDAIDGAEAGEDWVVEFDGKPVGLVQYCRFTDYPDYVAEMKDVYPRCSVLDSSSWPGVSWTRTTRSTIAPTRCCASIVRPPRRRLAR